MKKILSLIMALMLLALCPAMAETAVETQMLVSPDGSYSLEVPADYIPMDSQFMLSILSSPEMQQIMAQALGLQDASQLSMYFELMEANNMMIVYSSDMAGNINVQTAEASLTMEMLEMLKAMMDGVMIEQYAALGVAEEDIHPMDIQEIGGHRWYGMQLTMAGLDMQTMMTVENGVQYTVSFTDIDANDMQSILESFKVAEAAAE